MKRRYERPSAYIEEFTPNEYVAACGDSGTVYKFVCNAGTKNEFSPYHYRVTDEKGNLITNRYEPCGETHQASAEDEFIIGYIDDKDTWRTDEHIKVYIWRPWERDPRTGKRWQNTHCTLDLDKNNWATNKS